MGTNNGLLRSGNINGLVHTMTSFKVPFLSTVKALLSPLSNKPPSPAILVMLQLDCSRCVEQEKLKKSEL